MGAVVNKTDIGILGKGNLANFMIDQLLNAKLSVNVSQAHSDNLVHSNACFYNSITSFVRACPVIITVMSDTPELEDIFFGDEGIVQFIRAGSIIIDMSAVSPEFLQELSERLMEKEISFLDAVIISESKKESRAIRMMLVGGESSVYEQVLPMFNKIAKSVRHIGANGASQFYRQAFAVRRKN